NPHAAQSVSFRRGIPSVMSISDLVQVGESEYIRPDDVIRIYVGQAFEDRGVMQPPTTYVVIRTSPPLALFGERDGEQVVCSKWPIDRVRAALGVTNADALDEMYDK